MEGTESGRITRRVFALGAAAAAGLAIGAAEAAAASEAPTAAPDGFRAALDLALLNAPHLPAADRPELEAQVRSVLEAQKALRAAAVPDGAEPDFVFQVMEGRR